MNVRSTWVCLSEIELRHLIVAVQRALHDHAHDQATDHVERWKVLLWKLRRELRALQENKPPLNLGDPMAGETKE